LGGGVAALGTFLARRSLRDTSSDTAGQSASLLNGTAALGRDVDTVPASPNTVSAKRGWFPALASSAIAVLALDLLTSFSHLEESLWSWGLAAFVYFALALFIGRAYGGVANILFVAVGIALGFFLDAIIVEGVLGLEKGNLWPIGIVIYWVIGCVPVALGFLLGNRWRARGMSAAQQAVAADGER
jgi:hypothetical protein